MRTKIKQWLLSREVLKTIVYKTLSVGTTYAFTYAITKDHTLAAAATSFEATWKIILYYGHEKAWNIGKLRYYGK